MDVWQVVSGWIHYPLIRFGETQVTFLTIFDFFVVIAIAYGISLFVQWILKRKVFKFARADHGFQYMISKIGGYAIFILGFFIGLEVLGIDLTSFTLLAGALGVGIGFGLQNIVNNFVSGVIILSERQLQVGDRIEVGAINGFIQKIGARSSLLLTTDHLLIVMPNSELISKPVVRWWGRDERYPCRLEVHVGVGYESNLNQVRQLLLEIAASNLKVLKDPAPFAGIFEFTDNTIVFKLFVSSLEMINKEMALKTELYIAIQEEFKKNGIAMPFPQLEVRLKNNE